MKYLTISKEHKYIWFHVKKYGICFRIMKLWEHKLYKKYFMLSSGGLMLPFMAITIHIG